MTLTSRSRDPRTNPRASPDPKVDRILAELPPGPRAVGEALRDLVRKTAPGLTETVKWGNPFWVGRANTVCLMIYPNHVNLGLFRGAELATRFAEVEGTGKSLRHVKVRRPEDAGRPVLARIVRAAVALDRAGPGARPSRGRPARP